MPMFQFDQNGFGGGGPPFGGPPPKGNYGNKPKGNAAPDTKPQQLGIGVDQELANYNQRLDSTRAAAASDPSLALYKQQLGGIRDQLGAFGQAGGPGGGGGGGGGFKVPGEGEEFGKFKKSLIGSFQDRIGAESPFGDSAVARRTEDLDMQTAQQKEQLKGDLINRGFQEGTPQYNKAMQDLNFSNNRQKSSVIQQMAESDAQFGLQNSQILLDGFNSFSANDMQNRQLIMKGQQMNAAAASSAAASATANAKWKIMLELQMAGQEFGAGQSVDKDMWGRMMESSAFDNSKSQWGKEFDYTKEYNTQMISLQRELANQAAKKEKSKGLFGFLGNVLGAVGGFVLGGPAGAVAGSSLGGSLLGGGGGQETQAASPFDTGLSGFNLSQGG